ncbi:MAG: hypothetical protein U9R74_05950 [Pseudomonadota bacterium]|nr:hypothetical protein [Pseudomonadota bacterium]
MVNEVITQPIFHDARGKVRTFCILCILASLFGSLAQAAQRTVTDRWVVPGTERMRSGYFPGTFSTVSRDVRRNGNPTQMGIHATPVSHPGYRPGYPAQLASGGQTVGSGPRVEQELADSTAYIHQALVYTVRVVSDQNLKTLKPIVSHTGGIVWEKLEGPLTSMRIRNGKSEIINEYRYVLTPIASGAVTVEPIRFTGTLAAAGRWPGARQGQPGARFDVTSGNALELNVLPAEPGVVPWLPLRGLKLEGKIEDEASVAEGKPLNLLLKLKAVGAPGSRLPSLEHLLQGQGYEVYRESVSTEQSLVNEGQTLIGVRSENYTLVPNQAGGMQLPEIRIGWFNVDTGLKEESVLPVTRMVALGTGGVRGVSGGSLPPVWIPFLIILVGSILYWVSLALRGSRFGQRVYQGIASPVRRVSARAVTVFRAVSDKLRPRRLMHNVQRRLVVLVPKPLRLWYCLRCIDDETDPAEWCQAFRFIASKHVGISDQLTSHGLMQCVIDNHPGAHASAIWQLTHQLEGAMYGEEPLDFEQWKVDFKRELRPMRFLKLEGRRTAPKGLPALNPGVLARGG